MQFSGFAVIGWIIASNRNIFARPAGGPLALAAGSACTTPLGIASIVLGWYFNIHFVQEYSHGSTNPLWGQLAARPNSSG